MTLRLKILLAGAFLVLLPVGVLGLWSAWFIEHTAQERVSAFLQASLDGYLASWPDRGAMPRPPFAEGGDSVPASGTDPACGDEAVLAPENVFMPLSGRILAFAADGRLIFASGAWEASRDAALWQHIQGAARSVGPDRNGQEPVHGRFQGRTQDAIVYAGAVHAPCGWQVLAVMDVTPVLAEALQVRQAALFLGGGAALLSLALLLWATRVFLYQPVRRLRDTALRIASGEHVARAPAGPGEIFVSLARAMERLSGMIRDREQALLEHQRKLEDRVREFTRERTRELTEGHAALLREKAITHSILEDILAGYWDWDLRTDEEYLSPTFKRMFGYRDHELPNRPESWQRLMLPEDLARLEQSAARLGEHTDNPAFYHEVRFRHRNGSIVWVLCAGRVIEWDGQGRPARMVGCHIDITERKAVEAALHQTTARLHSILDHSPLLFSEFDLTGRCLLVNPICAAVQYNRTVYEVTGRSVGDLLPEEQARRIMERIQRVQGSGTFMIHEEPAPGLTAGRYYMTTAFPLYDGSWEPNSVGFISLDVTETRRADQECVARKAAEEASRMKSLFLANMSHEIRTPLNAVLGFAQVLAHDAALSQKQADHARTILRSGRHLLHLLNDILDMSKIEAGLLEVREEDFSPASLFQELARLYQPNAADKGLEFRLTVDSGPAESGGGADPAVPSVPADPAELQGLADLADLPGARGDLGKLRQILMNLLGNAVKFTQAGSVALRVAWTGDVALEAGKRPRLRVVVEDNGPGIAAEDLDRVFDPFWQTETGAQAGGTGLGLPISRKLAQLMGGTLTVDSRPGQGCRFTLDLPLAVSEAQPARRSQATRLPQALDPDSGPVRILIADDRADSLDLLRTLLEGVGFTVRDAANGQEVLDICTAWAPHAVLLNLHMPVLDGFAAARRLKASYAGPETMVIAVTAGASQDVRDRALEAGVDDVLIKPVQAGELFALLERGLGLGYVYPGATGGDAPEPDDPEPANLDNVPPDLRAGMAAAVFNGDMSTLQEMITNLGETHPAAAKMLRALADSFDYAGLSDLLGDGREG